MNNDNPTAPSFPFLQHVDIENSYLCGYLKITGLTFEFPTLTTFFDGEIISNRYPFLTRKWEADEDVDRKHWVSGIWFLFSSIPVITSLVCLLVSFAGQVFYV